MTVRLLGYWKSSLKDSYALPQHFESVLDPSVRQALAVYLDAGQPVNQYRGYSYCRYGCGDNGSAERTDGEWLWPEGLAHYVVVHNVVLPDEFMDHVSKKQYPSRAHHDSARVDADETDWLRWSEEKMPRSFKTAVANAILESERCTAATLAVAISETEAEHGLSQTMCMQAGCERYACQERALCAACLIAGDGTGESIRFDCESEQLAVLLDTFSGNSPEATRSFLRSIVTTVTLHFRRLFSR